MKNSQLSALSRLLMLFSAILLTISIFVPIWRIELDAPQYPEGLKLLIYSDNLGGNVDIINGLNHYIGMKTLHAEEFIEFAVLPYIIGVFAALSLFVSLVNRKKLLYTLLSLFVLFGILAMVDFWRWEYNYGHNLDPSAAIIVPGMAYQPPLIGFKQLLNFGAYSIPDVGGWMFIGSGILMLFATMKEMNFLRKFFKKKINTVAMLFLFFLTSCASDKPEPIKLNKDNCDFCKMTISNGQFGAELKTKKGRTYKFDDISCMVKYTKENTDKEIVSYFIHDYVGVNTLIDARNAYFIKSEEIESPMGGNIAAFKKKSDGQPYLVKFKAAELKWEEVIK